MNVYGIILSCGVALAGVIRADQTVVERGPHHTVLESIETVEADGIQTLYTNRVVQLGSGLNYWSAEQNSWIESTDLIELVNDRAVYRQGQYRLGFSADIKDQNGAIEWFPSDDNRIVVQTVGLALTDRTTGDSIWLAQLKSTQGFITAENEVTWPSCFDNIDASVRVTVRPFGFENDVILHERIGDGGFDNPQLETWHQIISGAPNEVTPSSVKRPQGTDADSWLRFNQMLIGPGNAFLVGDNGQKLSSAPGESIPVAKEYFVDPDTGMKFLIESVPLGLAKEHLKSLPAGKGAFNVDDKVKNRLQAMRRQNVARHRPIALFEKAVEPEKKKVAAMTPKKLASRGGLLLDFSTLVTQTNQIFAGHTTYVVASNSAVNLSLTTVLEPSCVIKMGQSNPGNTLPIINILGTLDCQTKPYAPAIFTSREDRTVGETNSALTASINTNVVYGAYHLYFVSTNSNPITLHDVKTRYASNSFGFAGSGNVEVYNLQAYGIAGNLFEISGTSNAFRNVLAHNVKTVLAPQANNLPALGEHLTIHSASKTFSVGSFTGCTFNLLNSMQIVVTNSSSSGLSTNSTVTLSDDTGIFQTVGSGAHYLANNSPYRNSGSTSISSRLSGEIFRYSTTYPPQVLSGTISVNTTLTPQAQRDLDIPDSGFHYASLDYAIGGVTLASSTTLTLTNGVAVATYGPTALTLNSSSKLLSEGTPLNMNRLVRFNTVQEQPADWGTVSATYQMLSCATSVSQVSLRFTEIAHIAYSPSSSRTYLCNTATDFPTDFTVKDCQLYTTLLGVNQSSGGGPTFTLVNDLFHRSQYSFFVGYSYSASINIRNNLFRYSSSSVYNGGTLSGSLTDNLFDNGSVGTVGTVFNSNNGYINTTVMSGSYGGDKTVSSGDYQMSTLGRWYYPTNGGNLSTLVDAGTRTSASAGLFHHTVRTDQTKDSGTVDIGFHFVAIDGNGNPVDTDNDGIPDYLEDRNGNGTVDSGEIAWTYPINDGGGLIVFTPLQP